MVEDYVQLDGQRCRLDLTLENYKPLPAQKAFHKSKSKYRAFISGVGGGKTLALCYEAIRCAYANAGTMGLVASPTFRMSRDLIEPQLVRILNEEGIPHTFNKSDRAVYLEQPKTTIILRSVDDPEKLRGTNLSFIGFDEAAMCPMAPWDRLIARLREPRANWLTAFISTTPCGKNWLYERFVNPRKRLPGHEAIIAKPKENYYLNSDFYANLKQNYNERFYKQEVEAAFVDQFEGAAYWSFNHELNVKSTFFDPALPVAWSLDFNVDPLCSVITQKHPVSVDGSQWRVHVLDEIILTGSNTVEACIAFESRIRKWIPSYGKLRVRVYGDPSGNSRQTSASATDYTIIRDFFARQPNYEATFYVGSAHPQVRDRCQLVNSILKNAAGEARLWIDPRCEELIKDLEMVHYKADIYNNILPILDKNDPARTHISDALGYMLWEDFGDRSPGGYVKDYAF